MESSYRPRMSRVWKGSGGSWDERWDRVLREGAGDRDFSLEKASRSMHLSRRSLQRKLQERGTTFRAELLRTRAEIAQDLLRQGLAIGHVARSVGYQREHFSKAFKRHCGVTPGAYRSRSRSS